MKYFKKVMVIILVCMLVPIKVWAAESVENPEIVKMNDEEAEEYLEMYYPDDGAALYGKFRDGIIGVQKSGSKLLILYTVSTGETVSELGVKNIILEVKNGLIWIPIKIAEKDYRTNASNFTGGFYYNNPTSGSTYRASGILYAIVNGKEYTTLADSGSFTFR